MSLINFKARNHRQQKPSEKVDDRSTTWEDFQEFSHNWGPFDLDAAALPHNAKCGWFYSPKRSGLTNPWSGRVWCNPPYSDIDRWVARAWDQSDNCERIVMLLPANRTEQAWWQDMIEPYRGKQIKVHFLRGRRRFIAHDDDQIRPNSRPPFGVCLVIWDHG